MYEVQNMKAPLPIEYFTLKNRKGKLEVSLVARLQIIYIVYYYSIYIHF